MPEIEDAAFTDPAAESRILVEEIFQERGDRSEVRADVERSRLTRPAIPVEAVIKLRSKSGVGVDAPGAVGPVRVEFRIDEIGEDVSRLPRVPAPEFPCFTRDYVQKVHDIYDTDARKNCPAEHGGISKPDGSWKTAALLGRTLPPFEPEADPTAKIVWCRAADFASAHPRGARRAGHRLHHGRWHVYVAPFLREVRPQPSRMEARRVARWLLMRHFARAVQRTLSALLATACASAEPDDAPQHEQAAALEAPPPAQPVSDASPIEPTRAPKPVEQAAAEETELSPYRFQDEPAEVLAVTDGPRPGRGKGQLTGLELELLPIGNEAVLRISNRSKRRVWWCSTRALMSGISAIDDDGNAVARPTRCPWAPPGDEGCTFGGPTGPWSLAPGESQVVLRARVRQTDEGLIVELGDDDGSEKRWEGQCLVIDRDRARLRARWTIGEEGFRKDWCYADARKEWDRYARYRKDAPWAPKREPDMVFPPRREEIDRLPILGELSSNHVEVVARRAIVEMP